VLKLQTYCRNKINLKQKFRRCTIANTICCAVCFYGGKILSIFRRIRAKRKTWIWRI